MSQGHEFQREWLPPYPVPNKWIVDGRKPPDAPHVDWKIVPMARSAEHILPAARLSRAAGSMLLVLCSRDAKVDEVADQLEHMPNPPGSWTVVDVRRGYKIPNYEPTVRDAIPEHARLDPEWDLSLKRNLGLLICRSAVRAFIMDDDLWTNIHSLNNAAWLSMLYEKVGMQCALNPGFEDMSVYMHARKDLDNFHVTGVYKESIGAGMISLNSAMIDMEKNRDHCSDIYNEDWFFFLRSALHNQVAVANAFYHQKSFDPYADPNRARREEYGDLAAYGMYAQLEQLRNGGKAPNLADRYWWDQLIEKRRDGYLGMLDSLSARRNPDYLTYEERQKKQFDPMSQAQQEKRRRSLQAGLEMNETLDGSMFVDFPNAWHEENRRWEHMIDTMPDLFGAYRRLAYLGLAYITGGKGKKTTRHGMS